MLHAYPAVYRDRHGEIHTTLFNDGTELWMMLRGIEFPGRCFDDLEPPPDYDYDALSQFMLDRYRELRNYELDCDIPLPVVTTHGQVDGMLHVHYAIGEQSGWSLSRYDLRLTLHYDDRQFESREKGEWFDDSLLDIQKQLPAGEYVKACINCALADSHPGGPARFGQWSCFRDNKAGFFAARTKMERMAIWHTCTEDVQEIHLCSQFQRHRDS